MHIVRGLELINLKLVGVSENIFSFNNINEHELVFAYVADLFDKGYETNLVAQLDDKGNQGNLIWASLEEIQKVKLICTPLPNPHL